MTAVTHALHVCIPTILYWAAPPQLQNEIIFILIIEVEY